MKAKILSCFLALVLVLGAWPGASLGAEEHKILGPPTTSVAKMQEWAQGRQATQLFIDLAPVFYQVASDHGVDPRVVYAQSAKETNYMKFTGVLDASFKNPCGLKVREGGSNTDPEAHARFSSWEEGIRAQVEHLALYAGKEGYPLAQPVDPRHFPSLHGTAPRVEDLGGRWAPSKEYGRDIVKMMADMEDLPGSEEPAPPEQADPPQDPPREDPGEPVDPIQPEVERPKEEVEDLLGELDEDKKETKDQVLDKLIQSDLNQVSEKKEEAQPEKGTKDEVIQVLPDPLPQAPPEKKEEKTKESKAEDPLDQMLAASSREEGQGSQTSEGKVPGRVQIFFRDLEGRDLQAPEELALDQVLEQDLGIPGYERKKILYKDQVVEEIPQDLEDGDELFLYFSKKEEGAPDQEPNSRGEEGQDPKERPQAPGRKNPPMGVQALALPGGSLLGLLGLAVYHTKKRTLLFYRVASFFRKKL